MKNDLVEKLFAGYLLVVFGLTQTALPQQKGGLNLVPLSMMTRDLAGGGEGFFVNFLGNLVLLAPLGVLLPILRPAWGSAPRIALAGAGLSLLIESLQFASGRRVADVDDILLNTASALFGYLAFVAARAVWRSRTRDEPPHRPRRPIIARWSPPRGRTSRPGGMSSIWGGPPCRRTCRTGRAAR